MKHIWLKTVATMMVCQLGANMYSRYEKAAMNVIVVIIDLRPYLSARYPPGNLMSAEIIDDKSMPKDEALIGATVTVKDESSGDEFDYMLVSEEESDYENNKISVSSPVGKALLGHKVGDVVEIEVPAGTLSYEIVKISR